MIRALVLSRSMKKTPTTEAPTEPKEDPVPEELVPAQVLKPSEERTGTLDCSLAPRSHPDGLWLPLVILEHQAVLWTSEILGPV